MMAVIVDHYNGVQGGSIVHHYNGVQGGNIVHHYNGVQGGNTVHHYNGEEGRRPSCTRYLDKNFLSDGIGT